MTAARARRRRTWIAAGAVVAIGCSLTAWHALAAPGDIDATYVPVENCRLLDTRRGPDNVGPRSTPLGAGDPGAHVQQVTGSNGKCTIPDDATAAAMNVTIVNPSAQSNLRVHPADTATPLASNLNWLAGQSPTPNKVDVKLSNDGAVRFFNQNGTVDVVADVVGYYTNTTLLELAQFTGVAGPQGPTGAQGPAGADGVRGPEGPVGPAGRRFGNEITWSTSPATTGRIGLDSSIAIGVDGNPIVSHYDVDSGTLRVTHCHDPACTSAATTNPDPGAGLAVGRNSSMTIGADGLPVISHHDIDTGDLRVTRCDDPGCTSANTSVPDDTTNRVGVFSSITIGADGRPIIAHYDQTDDNLRVSFCGDAACTTATTRTPDEAGMTSDVGLEPDVTIGVDGNPIIAHYDATGDLLRITHCSDAGCTTATTSTPDDATSAAQSSPTITIGVDGNPIIAHHGAADGDLRVTRCQNTACSTATTVTPDDDADAADVVGVQPAITIGVDGRPIIAHYDSTNGDLRVTRCDDTACSAASSIVADGEGTVGEEPSITIDDRGEPVISHTRRALPDFDLRVTTIRRAAWTENAWES